MIAMEKNKKKGAKLSVCYNSHAGASSIKSVLDYHRWEILWKFFL